jgi:hypothetical protein
MNESESVLVVKLAQVLLRTKIDFAFYKRNSGLGEIPGAGHPGLAA